MGFDFYLGHPPQVNQVPEEYTPPPPPREMKATRKLTCPEKSRKLSWMILTFIYIRSSYMNYFIYFTSFTPLTGKWEPTIDLAPNVCGFIAQLVEHRTGNAEVTGSNPVEA